MQEFLQQLVTGIAAGGIFASLALALVLIYNAMGLVNFAQGEMAMLATFVAYALISRGMSYWIVFPVTLVLASAVGAVSGLMVAPILLLEPNMMQSIIIYAFAAAVLGGIESPLGAVVGGVIVGVTVNLAGAYLPFVGGDLQLAVGLAIIVAVLVIKPNGLFGRARVRRV